MKKSFMVFSFVVMVALAVFVMSEVPYAHAGFVLEIEDMGVGGAVHTAYDDGSGADRISGDGTIQFSGSTTNWVLNFTSGTTGPGNSLSILSLNGYNTSAPATLEIRLTNTGYSGSPTSMTQAINSTNSAATVTAKGYFDATNSEFGIGGEVVALGPLTTAGYNVSGSTGVAAPVGDFSLTTVVRLTHAEAGQTSMFGSTLSVPEPGIMTLLGVSLVGLIGVGTTRRFKGAKKE